MIPYDEIKEGMEVEAFCWEQGWLPAVVTKMRSLVTFYPVSIRATLANGDTQDGARTMHELRLRPEGGGG